MTTLSGQNRLEQKDGCESRLGLEVGNCLGGDEFRWKEEIGLMCRMPVLCKASSVKVDMVE